MAKSKGKIRRSSDDAESTTSSVSTASRTASAQTPPSPRLNGSPPKRRPTLRTAADERQKRIVNFRERTLWTFILLAGYFTLLAMGHMYIIVIVTIVQIIVYKEVIALASVPAEEKKIPFFKVLNWYDSPALRCRVDWQGTFWLRQCSFCMVKV
jgi:phosphatidate cytidylyltransferase